MDGERDARSRNLYKGFFEDVLRQLGFYSDFLRHNEFGQVQPLSQKVNALKERINAVLEHDEIRSTESIRLEWERTYEDFCKFGTDDFTPYCARLPDMVRDGIWSHMRAYA